MFACLLDRVKNQEPCYWGGGMGPWQPRLCIFGPKIRYTNPLLLLLLLLFLPSVVKIIIIINLLLL